MVHHHLCKVREGLLKEFHLLPNLISTLSHLVWVLLLVSDLQVPTCTIRCQVCLSSFLILLLMLYLAKFLSPHQIMGNNSIRVNKIQSKIIITTTMDKVNDKD
jgi:hypothetical protein